LKNKSPLDKPWSQMVHDFFARVEELRLWRGLTEEEMLTRTPIHYRAYQEFKGDSVNTKINRRHQEWLAHALDVDFSDLFQAPKGLKPNAGKKRRTP
jgi:transcriptional regulator with XRE-family HTH domain